MFDPSKLDLNLEDEKIPHTELVPKKRLENSEKNEEKISDSLENQEQIDVLGSLDISENNQEIELKEVKIEKSKPKIESIEDILENKSVLNDMITKNEEETIGKTEYERNIVKTENPLNKKDDIEEKIVFDINITNLNIFLDILVDNEYDFATFEPSEEAVKIVFRKDKVIVDTRYIKFPTYTNILIKAKGLTKLTIEETEQEQEGSGDARIKNKSFKVTTKVVPAEQGPKLFIKANQIEKKLEKKDKPKTSISQILGFLGAIAFITLVIGGAFIGFVVLNATTIEDVKFFYSLGINLNDINTFMGQALAAIFSTLIFIETIFLIMYLFKFSLTKKEFRQKKIRFGILSTIVLILTFSTASAWMIIDQKIKSLPNWQEMAYGDVQIYDNSKLLSESFNKEGSLLAGEETSNLIGPVEIKFDLSFFTKKEEQKSLKIKKYIWDFGNGDVIETPLPTIIHNFNKKGNHEVTLNIQEVDLQGKVIEKEVENIPNINIAYVVDINEKKLNNGGKLVDFDATSLKELGKIEWYFVNDDIELAWKGEEFRNSKVIFEETLIGMYIRRNDKESEELDKLFIINGEEQTSLNGSIEYTRGLVKDLEFDIWLENLENDFGNGYIEEFKWIIGDKEITKEGDITDPKESSKIHYEFKSYGEHEIKVILKDSAGETKEIKTIIDIPKQLKLLKPLRIFDNGELLEDTNYEINLNEYYINEIGIPTNLKFDARFIKSNNLLYSLKSVGWDYDSNGDIDESTKTGNYEISIEGNHTITVHYEFVHRKIADDIINIKEQIFIEGIKKEAIINFDITKDSDYVPVVVAFDASKSQVKDENIEKFIWDYGDGLSEERDAIVPGHKYTTPGNYDVSLTVVTTTGKEFSYSKKLILKPKPQSVKITSSMKNAPVGQGIDFSSDESEGQIIGYFWDFGDGNTSTEANPSHTFNKEGEFEVKLKLDYTNKNLLEDTLLIKTFKE